jgi:hypothetical protein
MGTWQRDPSRNLLSPENVDRVKSALEAGPIFGYWYRVHGGFGPVYWFAQQFDQLMTETSRAKPGDLYVIWSLPVLLVKNLALAAARYADIPAHGTSLLSPESMQAIEDYLSERQNEIFAVFYGTDRGPEVWVNDRDGLDYVVECAEWYNRPEGEAYIFPFTAIEIPEHWLLEAQYPNDRGEVLVERAE